MIVYFGADHRGFNLKEKLKTFAKDKGYEVVDLGNVAYEEGDDYPDFALSVAEKVCLDPEGTRGVLVCGSGVGMDIAANKFPGIRATIGFADGQVYKARRDDNINVVSLAADFMNEGDAKKILEVFLVTPFSGEERYLRRLKKIARIEKDTHS